MIVVSMKQNFNKYSLILPFLRFLKVIINIREFENH